MPAVRRVPLVIAAVVLVSALSCVHQLQAPADGRPGAERSVFPIIVVNPHAETVLSGGDAVLVTKYAACTAVFVSPHLMATSTAAFPRTTEGTVSRADADILIRDGDFRLHPVDVAYADWGNGIVIVKTEEAGTPVTLNGLPFPVGHDLIVESFAFKSVDGRLLPPEWNVVRTTPDVEPYTGAGTSAQFRIAAVVSNGSCGAPVFDEDGRLAGIIRERHHGYSSVISASAIASALQGVSR